MHLKATGYLSLLQKLHTFAYVPAMDSYVWLMINENATVHTK